MEIQNWFKSFNEKNVSYVFVQQKLVSAIAQITAATIHLFHKTGQVMSIREHRQTVEEIESLSK